MAAHVALDDDAAEPWAFEKAHGLNVEKAHG